MLVSRCLRTFLFLLLSSSSLLGQQGDKALVAFKYEPVCGMYNFFRVVAQQEGPVTSDQVKAYLGVYDEGKQSLEITGEDGSFRVTPKSIGELTIEVELQDTTELFRFFVKPLEAIGRYGMASGRDGKSMNKNVFKAQRGIYARVEGYDICANCQVLRYEIILVRPSENAIVVFNEGGNFSDENKQLISGTEVGDLYIFRKIRYRCPGARVDQRLPDMSFEIE